MSESLFNALFLFLGSWLTYRASSGKSPLPDLPRWPVRAEKAPKKHSADGMV